MRPELFRRYVYLLSSGSRILYTGSTADLYRRVYQHKEGLIMGFTRRYGVDRLVFYESHLSILAALEREREIKRWRRAGKIELIGRMNAGWLDLAADWFPELCGQDPSLRSG